MLGLVMARYYYESIYLFDISSPTFLDLYINSFGVLRSNIINYPETSQTRVQDEYTCAAATFCNFFISSPDIISEYCICRPIYLCPALMTHSLIFFFHLAIQREDSLGKINQTIIFLVISIRFYIIIGVLEFLLIFIIRSWISYFNYSLYLAR